ncbi:hypothetical protein ACZ87_01823 [Candidatus Erwinia dacicola]|uniref:Uncharacterized protein n=1 Tax=Candidatus Erwinia dacicola TaxID=252393 RepID=A0A328TU31_9GAMM|nr:hypothetical protein ACZ87_01823 [Candidatus Erwinia dacicola]
MLSGYWLPNPFSPGEESCLIVSSSSAGRLLEINPTSAMGNFDKAVRDICDWLSERLRA